MDKFLINGGKPLHGTVAISGAKNSALPAMAASLLTEERVSLHNIPRVRDIITMAKLLAFMGASVMVDSFPAADYSVEAKTISHAEAPYDLVKTMRASILTLGPTLARIGVARVSLPGGCAIGARPVDLHLSALEKMGAEIVTAHGYIEARAPRGRLQGGHVKFEKITVTGTENVLMAATLADGETVLENVAREPEITDLIELLRKMGAKISGDGTATLRIEGVQRLAGADHTVIPDRIEAGTFLVAGAITGGDLSLINCDPEHLGATIALLQKTGAIVETTGPHRVRVRAGLVLAGLVASGETIVERVYHIDRGYERIVEKLQALGAAIARVHGQ